MNLQPLLNKKVKIILFDKKLKRDTTYTGEIIEITSDSFTMIDKYNKTIVISKKIFEIKRIDEL